jgi:DNA polymerase I-like protein with 3'-5' exonuclease and polymerase domains
MRTFPNIKSVFQAEIEQQLRSNRTLTNPFGRRRIFYDRWGDDLLRDGYAYIPQSTTADYINAPLPDIESNLPKSASLLLQVHDEICLECDPKDVSECASILKKYIEVPILVGTEEMTIPLDISVGPNWADTVNI